MSDGYRHRIQVPLDSLIGQLLELNKKQHEQLKDVVELHRLELLASLEKPADLGLYDSYEFSEAELDPGDLHAPSQEKQVALPFNADGVSSPTVASNCNVPNMYNLQPLSMVKCTQQPAPPGEDSWNGLVATPRTTEVRRVASLQLPPDVRLSAKNCTAETASTADAFGTTDDSGAVEDKNTDEREDTKEKGLPARSGSLANSRTNLDLETGHSAAANLKLSQERRNGFDTCIGILVLLNAFVMVLDLECQGNEVGFASGIIGRNVWRGFDPTIVVLEHCFAIAFLLELIYRVATEGRKYFKEAMNIFDTALVLIACVDLYILTPLMSTSSFNNTSTLRILRTVKLVRAFRIVRALRLFRGLRLLIKACSSFLPSLCWSMALLGLFMMMGALFMGNLLQDYILDEDASIDNRRWMWMHYGTAYRAIYTMFEITFAGNWPTYARPVLENVGHGYAAFYILYITFVVFAVIRVISAIFLRETLEAANNDAEMLVQDRLHKKTTYVRKLEGIFQACDESGDGVLTEDELTELMRDPRVQVYLESLEIDVRESTALFRLLQNSEGVISCDDFIEGILRCKGPARAIDQILLGNDVKYVAEEVQKLTKLLGDAGVINDVPRTTRNRTQKRNIEDELALLPSMQMTLSGRYIMT